MGIIRFAVKSGLAGGIVYYSVQEGLWSNSDDTIRLYRRMYGSVAPYVKENIPKEVVNEISDIPSLGTLTNCAKGMWNNGVKISINFISMLPTHISNGVDSLMIMSGAKDAMGSISSNSGPSKPQ